MEDAGKEDSPWRELRLEDGSDHSPPWLHRCRRIVVVGSPEFSGSPLGHALNAGVRDRRSLA